MGCTSCSCKAEEYTKNIFLHLEVCYFDIDRLKDLFDEMKVNGIDINNLISTHIKPYLYNNNSINAEYFPYHEAFIRTILKEFPVNNKHHFIFYFYGFIEHSSKPKDRLEEFCELISNIPLNKINLYNLMIDYFKIYLILPVQVVFKTMTDPDKRERNLVKYHHENVFNEKNVMKFFRSTFLNLDLSEYVKSTKDDVKMILRGKEYLMNFTDFRAKFLIYFDDIICDDDNKTVYSYTL
jgi:hypothetical protein